MFTLDAFIDGRPFLYHFTATENLANIREMRTLLCSAELAKQACISVISEKRDAAVQVSSRHKLIWLQGQKPLYDKNICFEGGWQMQDLLLRLNSLVFFWPGITPKSADYRPSDYGARHFLGNVWPSNAAAIRVDTRALFLSAKPRSILFSTYNSGSPRWSNGRASPRGPDTFLPAAEFQGTLSNVVEVAINDSVGLPESAQFARSIKGSWHPLFS